jgi:hypothetical protein
MKIYGNIRSVKDWFRIAPPKQGIKHWVDGRSAKELAKAWFPKQGEAVAPKEFMDLFKLLPVTYGIQFEQGEAELNTRFDDCGGEDRNADLVLLGPEFFSEFDLKPLALQLS